MAKLTYWESPYEFGDHISLTGQTTLCSRQIRDEGMIRAFPYQYDYKPTCNRCRHRIGLMCFFWLFRLMPDLKAQEPQASKGDLAEGSPHERGGRDDRISRIPERIRSWL